MTEIAHELSRRASPRYLGEQAKETALNKTMEWKDDIISSPLALGLIGGALGAAIGGSIARGRRTSMSYPGAASKIGDRAQELKNKAGDVVSGVREQLPSATELGEMADENPMLVALGGVALGAIAALLLPVSRKERELLEPVKRQASEAIEDLGAKIGDTVDRAQEKIAGARQESSGVTTTEGPGDDIRPLTH